MLSDRRLTDYEPIIGSVAASKLRQVAQDLMGQKIIHVNSTREGGGVAEILNWMIPLMRDLGLDADWEVIDGNPEYFEVTKAFHNGLQGQRVVLTEKMTRVYEDTVEANCDRLRAKLEDADYVIVHDPQPAKLLDLCPNRRGKWIWRCHIDVSQPNRKVWNYVRSMVNGYDASIFSMADFARSLGHPQFIVAPSIDPLSDKNVELGINEIHGVLTRFKLDPDRPVITQISRFDRFKDPVGVIEAVMMLNSAYNVQLVLAGGGATDDPEGAAVLEEVQMCAEGHENIHVLLLPPDAHRIINALQRASTIVLQKSLQEGFGLTVTEAMWKGKPVIGGNVGGIRLQIHNAHTGFLVDTPEGAALRMHNLLGKPELMTSLGHTARQFVRENFLCNRQLREYMTLMLGLKRGLANHLVAS